MADVIDFQKTVRRYRISLEILRKICNSNVAGIIRISSLRKIFISGAKQPTRPKQKLYLLRSLHKTRIIIIFCLILKMYLLAFGNVVILSSVLKILYSSISSIGLLANG